MLCAPSVEILTHSHGQTSLEDNTILRGMDEVFRETFPLLAPLRGLSRCESLMQRDDSLGFLALVEGKPIGMALLSTHGALGELRGTSEARLEYLATSKSQRKLGIGSLLLKEVEDSILTLPGKNRLSLESSKMAISFYKKHGFSGALSLDNTEMFKLIHN